MKNYLFMLLLFSICSITEMNAQVNTVEKSYTWVSGTGAPTHVPDVSYDSEWYWDHNNKSGYFWDRSAVAWIVTDIANSYDDKGDGVLIINDGHNVPFTIDVVALANNPTFIAAMQTMLGDHLNKDQVMNPANGTVRLHIINGRLQWQGTMPNVDGIDFLNPNGNAALSVDFGTY